MKEMVVDWSNLPEGLLDLIAVRLFSVIEHRRFGSICTSWRSPGSINPFTSRPLIHFDPIPRSNTLLHDVYFSNPSVFLSRAAFFRVTLSSSPSKGWLIKSDVEINSGRFRLLDPLSRRLLPCPSESLDLLEFTVSEIREAYAVLKKVNVRITSPRFQRSVVVKVKEGEDHRYGVLGIGWDDINYWNGRVFRKLKQIGHKFSDIIVHKGQTYVLDSKGSIWWIDSSLGIVRYGPSLGENITNGRCGDMSLVDCCGEFYIVDRLLEENPRKRKADSSYTNVSDWNAKTVGFKVYKFDDEKLGTMVEVKSLGDNALVMATDTCFSVLANEFYGCLNNSIYFTVENEIKVFKLDNGMITTMSEFSLSSFQMFIPSFL